MKVATKVPQYSTFHIKTLNLPFFQDSSLILEVIPLEFNKKKDTFNYQFFERNSEMKSNSKSEKPEILKLVSMAFWANILP